MIILIFVLFPFFSGMLLSLIINKGERSAAGIFLCGFFTLFSVFEICSIPCMLMKKDADYIACVFFVVMSVLSLIGALCFIFRIGTDGFKGFLSIPAFKKDNMSGYIFALMFFVMFALQMYAAIIFRSVGRDDAEDISSAFTVAIYGIYKRDLFTGNYTAVSSLPDLYHILIAVFLRLTGLPMEELLYQVLTPLFMTVMYLICFETGKLLFKDKNNLWLFMLIFSLINLFGGYSEHTREYHMMRTSWSREALSEGIVIPALLFVMILIAHEEAAKREGGEDYEARVRVNGLFALIFLINLTALCGGIISAAETLFYTMIMISAAAVCVKKPLLIFGGAFSVLPSGLAMLYAMSENGGYLKAGNVFTAFSKYSGSGAMMVVFFAALIFIHYSASPDHIKRLLVGGSIAVVLFLFFPGVYRLILRLGGEDAYNNMWCMLPISTGLSYAATGLVSEHRLNGLIMTASALFLCGSIVYGGFEIKPSEKEAKNSTLFIREKEGEGELRVAFTDELLPYVRMNDPYFILPYGDSDRERGNTFRELMNEERVNFTELALPCRIYGVSYVVLPKGRLARGGGSDAGFIKAGETDRYAIYAFGER